MSEMKFELRQPRIPLSQNLREGEMATQTVIRAVERLEAVNAKLLAALEDISLLADSYQRNRVILIEALRRQGMDCAWLNGWAAKFDRAAKAVKEATS